VKFNPQLSGKRVACPHCGKAVIMPQASLNPPPANPAQPSASAPHADYGLPDIGGDPLNSDPLGGDLGAYESSSVSPLAYSPPPYSPPPHAPPHYAGGAPNRRRPSFRVRKGIWIAAAVTLIGVPLLLATVAGGWYAYQLTADYLNSPSAALSRALGNFEAQRWGPFWDGLDQQSREEFARGQGVEDGAAARQLFVEMCQDRSPILGKGSFRFDIVDETILGNSAHVQFREHDGTLRTAVMVRENGAWKMALSETLRRSEWRIPSR
jgi:hypothetical protein